MEEIYNFGRKSLVGLKAAAIMAMRERSATNGANVNHGTKGQQSPLGA